jgi:hypothetical protein
MKRRKDVGHEDVFNVFMVTNEKEFTFYVTEIENDSINAGLITQYRQHLLKGMLNHQYLFDEKGKSMLI